MISRKPIELSENNPKEILVEDFLPLIETDFQIEVNDRMIGKLITIVFDENNGKTVTLSHLIKGIISKVNLDLDVSTNDLIIKKVHLKSLEDCVVVISISRVNVAT